MNMTPTGRLPIDTCVFRAWAVSAVFVLWSVVRPVVPVCGEQPPGPPKQPESDGFVSRISKLQAVLESEELFELIDDD